MSITKSIKKGNSQRPKITEQWTCPAPRRWPEDQQVIFRPWISYLNLNCSSDNLHIKNQVDVKRIFQTEGHRRLDERSVLPAIIRRQMVAKLHQTTLKWLCYSGLDIIPRFGLLLFLEFNNGLAFLVKVFLNLANVLNIHR